MFVYEWTQITHSGIFGHMPLKVQGLKFYYKLIHHKLPTYLQNLQLLTNSNINSHNTRGNPDIHIRRVTHTFAKNSLRHNIIPTLINNAPNSIKAKLITHSMYTVSRIMSKTIIYTTIKNNVQYKTVMYVNTDCTPSWYGNWLCN